MEDGQRNSKEERKMQKRQAAERGTRGQSLREVET
jgi:hypothetical protein